MKITSPRKSRSKPCCICRKRFTPNTRLGDRQKTCGSQPCKTERKRRVQAQWASDNADYWTERRLREQAARLEAGEDKPPNRPPPSGLKRLPTAYIHEELGAHAAVILAFSVRLQQRIAQVAIRKQAVELEKKLNGDLHRTPQVPLRAELCDMGGKLNGDLQQVAQVAIGDSGRRT